MVELWEPRSRAARCHADGEDGVPACACAGRDGELMKFALRAFQKPNLEVVEKAGLKSRPQAEACATVAGETACPTTKPA
jgi:hypothetical protein